MRQSTTTAPRVDASMRLALAVLRRHLTDEGDFSPDAIADIITHVRTEGCIDGARFVRPDEVDALTEVFISAFPAVSMEDPAWGAAPGREWMFRPADDVFQPTPEDWADYHAMMATDAYLGGFNAVRPANA